LVLLTLLSMADLLHHHPAWAWPLTLSMADVPRRRLALVLALLSMADQPHRHPALA